ncbi:MAG: hypothetical protein ACLFU5_08365, partial [Thermoplasmata archaeon]
MDKRGRITIPKKLKNAHDLDKESEFIIEDIDDETFILKMIDLKDLIEEVKKRSKPKNSKNCTRKLKKKPMNLQKKSFLVDSQRSEFFCNNGGL